MTPDLFDSPSVVESWQERLANPNDLFRPRADRQITGRPVRGNMRCNAALTFLYFLILHLSGGDDGAKEEKEP